MKNRLLALFSLQKLPFWGVFVLSVIMALATFVEKSHGSEYTYSHIYGSWWFSGLWGLLVVLSLMGIVKGQIYKNLPLLFVHISFILILAGAFCTKLFAEHGYVILNKDTDCSKMQADADTVELPFRMRLDTFYVSYYAGTNAPADYISHFSIMDKLSGKTTIGEVSMNNIFSYDGYRFYQSSFEDDWRTSILSVNHDSWGIPLTYAGYALFVLAMIWYLFSPQNAFRKLLNHPLLKKALIIILFIIPVSCFSQILTKDSLSVNKKQAKEFCKLWMLYDGRISPVTTFAHDFTLKITGKTSFSYLDANQFLMGFLFFPDKWQQVALFEVKDGLLKEELNAGTEKAALIDFYDPEGNYKLSKYWKDLSGNSPKTSLLKEVEKLDEKIQLINMLHNGSLLQIYPQKIDNDVKWFYPTQNLRTKDEQKNIKLIRNSLLSYYQAISVNSEENAKLALETISDYQKANAEEVLPSDLHRDIEIFYTNVNFTSILFKINLTLGLLSLLCVFFLADKRVKHADKIFFLLLILSFIVHTFSIGVRTYIGGRLPFSNGFETMLLIAWSAMLIAVLAGRKMPLIVSFGYLISGCSLLVAHLGMMNPRITPLVPVLSSPLLSIHVSVIMLAYTLLAFIMLNSLISLIQIALCRNKDVADTLKKLEQNKIYSLICLYPSLLFLGAGIFIGAVWANISWGRYWGWDPKEVWALITFLVYSLVIHQKNLKLFTDLFFFHAFGLLSFSTVLMTYFGVNYFLGGMHSYAGEMQFDFTIILTTLIGLVIAGLLCISYRKYKKIIDSYLRKSQE
ncbi:cytochrome c biogenesis protein CcsA [Dysgonomonas gadei]|uniref:cytochrome c biogenesis protein CcsA n=1 Tax=Dysgonomonas gadei TaxID=156974 RepID=UPI003AEF830F